MGGIVATVMALAGDALVALDLLAEGVLTAGEYQTHDPVSLCVQLMRSVYAASAMLGVAIVVRCDVNLGSSALSGSFASQ